MSNILDDLNKKKNQLLKTLELSPGASNINSALGMDAAPETKFTWQQQASEQAEVLADQKYEQMTSSAIGSRKAIQKNLNKAVDNAVLNKYTTAQTVDKNGWTGGHALDAKRQQDYLAASIQADMYGQMELQKAGYKSNLAQARLEYDKQNKALALEYYKTAMQNSLNEAQVTGRWFSPEIKDMLSQRTLAKETLNTAAIGSAEYQRAERIVNHVNTWFAENNLSETGIETLAAYQARVAAYKAKAEARLIQMNINSALQATEKSIESEKNILARPVYDSNGTKTGFDKIGYYTSAARDFYQTEKGKPKFAGVLESIKASEGEAAAIKYYKEYAPTDKDGKRIKVNSFFNEDALNKKETSVKNKDTDTSKPDGYYEEGDIRYIVSEGKKYAINSSPLTRTKNTPFSHMDAFNKDFVAYVTVGGKTFMFSPDASNMNLLKSYKAKIQTGLPDKSNMTQTSDGGRLYSVGKGDGWIGGWYNYNGKKSNVFNTKWNVFEMKVPASSGAKNIAIVAGLKEDGIYIDTKDRWYTMINGTIYRLTNIKNDFNSIGIK